MQLTLGSQPGVGGGAAAQVACVKDPGSRLRLEESNLLLPVVHNTLAGVATVDIGCKLDVVTNACQVFRRELALQTLHPSILSSNELQRCKQHVNRSSISSTPQA